VTGISPHPAGIQASVRVDGQRIRLTNTTATPLDLLDDDGQTVLRVDRAGVWRHRRPSSTGWVRVSDGPTARSGDTRVPRVPATRGPRPANGQTVITTWQLPLRYGAMPLTVHGRMEWHPLPAPRGWLIVTTVLGGCFVTVVLVTGYRQERRAAARQPAGPLPNVTGQ
jgi:hypothetical protein